MTLKLYQDALVIAKSLYKGHPFYTLQDIQHTAYLAGLEGQDMLNAARRLLDETNHISINDQDFLLARKPQPSPLRDACDILQDPLMRRCIILMYRYEYTQFQIARDLDIHQSTVSRIISKALNKLRHSTEFKDNWDE